MLSKNGRNLLKLWVGMAALLGFVLMPFLTCSATEQPRRGGTIVLANLGDPPNLNLALTTGTTAGRVMMEVFEGLVELDRDVNPLPGLAESWDISPDGLTITFHLAKNVKWHDGEPFTSKDVQFSLMEVVAKYQPRGRTIMANVESIETPDDHTAVFHMKKVYGPLLVGLVAKTCPIIPRHLYEGTDILKNPHNFSDPIGTGAFKFKEWVKGDHITLVRNDDYRKPGLPYLDRIIIRAIKDAGTRSLAFEKGEIDYLDWWTTFAQDYKRLASLPNVTVSPSHSAGIIGGQIAFNQKDNKILANLKVRQAIYHAIDSQFICDKARFGVNFPIDSPIPPSFRHFYNPNVKKYEYNPAKANKLLDEAGYPRGADGLRFKVRMTYELGYPYTEKPAQIIKPMLKEVGIDIQFEVLERAVLFDRVFAKYNYDIFMGAIDTAGDPAIGIARCYLTKDIRPVPWVNIARYSNPEVDRLFDEAASTMDRKKRVEAYFRIQEILTEELPYIWLYEACFDTNLVKSTFKNCFQRVYGPNFTEVWWTGGK